jgi:hypothetical protein
MVEATGNMAQISPEEAGEQPQRKTKKATKTKAAKPAEKVETAAAPEPEAAPVTTNGANKIDELEPEVSSTTKETLPAVEDPTGPGIQEKIRKERQELAEKMLSGKVDEGKLLKVTPQYIDAPIFPDAYCPKCGMKLMGNSKTGFKQSVYVHPFTPAIALGKPCELKGKKLRAPVARMEIIE